ncbi:MAG TPA: hypothetical protein VF329_11225 [Gammaproteobacteria bacterium]
MSAVVKLGFGFVAAIGASTNLALAQPGETAGTARESAPIDLTGYWVSVVFEDWKYRMVTPSPGIFDGIPLNADGRNVGEAWDPEADEAAGDACKAYGAPAIMRLPGRFRISWEDDQTLRIDTDNGEQTRLLHFTETSAGAPTRQGRSFAEWQPAPGGTGGSLKVTTDNLLPGYIRKNGAPYSELTTMTEYYDLHTLPNGDIYLTITTRVTDPRYFRGPAMTSTDLRKLPDDRGWNPTPCTGR